MCCFTNSANCWPMPKIFGSLVCSRKLKFGDQIPSKPVEPLVFQLQSLKLVGLQIDSVRRLQIPFLRIAMME